MQQPLLSATSHVQSRPLCDTSVQYALRRLGELFAQSRGPHGKLSVLRCASGSGHVTLTSSARRLLRGLAAGRDGPVRFILSALMAHVTRWPDCGLLVSYLCVALTASAVELALPRRLIAEARECIVADVVAYLESDECECRVAIAGVQSMLSLVSMVLCSKPTCHLDVSVDLLARLVLRAFLRCSPDGVVQYLPITGSESTQCELVDGILFEVPHAASTSRQRDIRVAIFHVSLAGDSPGVDAAVDVHDGVVWCDAVVTRLLLCAERLVAIGVGMLACQRVVHPRLKRFMRDHGVLVIDRLGVRYIDAVKLLTGATLLGDFNVTIQPQHLGHLQSVTNCTINNKNYLHLAAEDKPVCTLVLHCRTEEAFEELQLQCTTADSVLASTTQHPFALMGAGCWQSHLGGYIRKLYASKRDHWTEVVGCQPSQLLSVADDFARVLEASARSVASDPRQVFIDPRPPHHLWKHENSDSCQCGVFVPANDGDGGSIIGKPVRDDRQCHVLDPFFASVVALKNAVAISNMAILVEHYIQNAN